MKKIIALLLALTMCFALCACGKTTTAEPAAPAADPVPAEAAPTAPAEEDYTEITLQLSHHNAVDQPIGVALDAWAKEVNELTGGKVTIDVYPAASLYSSGDAQDAIIMGTLDMCLGDTSLLSSDEPAYALFSLPFMFDSYEAAEKVVYGEIGQTIDKMMEDNLGVKALGWTWNGFRNMDTKDPITSVADCKGYKLRSPGADIYMDTFKTLGMAPEPISWSECYTAMQSGVVDGVESGLEAFYTQGFYALGNNICLSRHMLSIIGPVINVEKWNSLNEKTQQLLLDTWAKYQAELDATVIAGEESYQEKLEAEGCNITTFENRQELIDLFTPYWSKNAEAGGYTELLNQTLELIAG